MLERALGPGRMGPLELEHRLVMGSMHLGFETRGEEGAMAAFYSERARGGAGLIITGGCAVNPEGAAGATYGLSCDERYGARLGVAVEAVHEEGGRMALQLFHAGRYADMSPTGAAPGGGTGTGGRTGTGTGTGSSRARSRGASRIRPVGPSAIPSRFSREGPVAMDEEMIWETIGDFARAAGWARELGFDGVEIMASEGYLINQFCSPLTNRREDGWGGDGEGRRRFALEVLGAVRERAGPELAVIVRMSGADLMEGSSSQEEVLDLARELAAGGADALNVGIGWHESRVPTVQGLVPAGSFSWAAARIRAALESGTGAAGEDAGERPGAAGEDAGEGRGAAGEDAGEGRGEAGERAGGGSSRGRAGAGVPVIAGNRVNSLEEAERMLGEGVCDFVSMARPFLADPAIVARGRRGRMDLVNVCVSCDQACIDRSLRDERVSCMVNPRAGRELEDPIGGLSPMEGALAPTGRARRPMGGTRVAVVGGGPAGLAAAEALGELGAEVELFEAGRRLGGQFRLAERIPGKGDFGAAADSFGARLEELGVRVHLEREIRGDEAGDVLAGFAGVVLATGVRPRGIELEGAELPRVRGYVEAIEHPEELGERVVIIGAGGIGVDVGHMLSDVRGESSDPGAFLAAHHLPPAHGLPPAPGLGPAPGRPPAHGLPPAPGLSPAPGLPPAPGLRRAPGLPPTGTGRAASGMGARRVTLVCRSARPGHGIGLTSRWAVLDSLGRAGVEIVTEARYARIVPEGLELAGPGGPGLLKADSIVLATGQLARDPLSGTLAALEIPHRVVGGARTSEGLDAVRAFAEGRGAAAELAGLSERGPSLRAGGSLGSGAGVAPTGPG